MSCALPGSGQVIKGTPFQLWDFPDTYADYLLITLHSERPSRADSGQSIVFSPGGSTVYLKQGNTSEYSYSDATWDLSSNPSDKISVLNITGPGAAEVGGTRVATLLPNVSGSFFGVDTMATSSLSVDSHYPVGVSVIYPAFLWVMLIPAITPAGK